VQEIFDTLEFSDVAIKKLFLDEPLSNAELDALFRSDYLSTPRIDGEPRAQELYVPSGLAIVAGSSFLFSDIEREVLDYFRRNPETLFSISPRRFEELVAAVFRNSGFDVQLTPETRDGGADIFAVRRDGLTGGALHIIECKRYEPSRKVGIGVVQRMLGVVEHHRATKGVVVTTSTFSKDARDFAACSQYRLGMSDYSVLTTWLRELHKR